MRLISLLLFVVAVGILIIIPGASQAQDTGTGGVPGAEGEMCPALVERALNELADSCGDLERNNACYGFNRVDATFLQEMAEDFFSRPADRTELTVVDTIHTAALDVLTERWGVAVLNVQANIPDTIPGQGVIFLLLGDVEVDSAGAEEAQLANTPLPIIPTTNANIRSAPSINANVIGSAPQGVPLTADGISTDGQWLHVYYGTDPGWISATVLEVQDFSPLPILSSDSTTEASSPMQAFYFRTGFGDPVCNEAPDLLTIQGPNRFTVDLSVNGADINIGSTAGMRTLPLLLRNDETLPANTPAVVDLDGQTLIELNYQPIGANPLTIIARSYRPGSVDTTLEVLNSAGEVIAENDNFSENGTAFALEVSDSLLENLEASGPLKLRIGGHNGVGMVEVTVLDGDAALDNQQWMQVMTVAGLVTVDGNPIPPGYTILAQMGADGNVSGSWTPPRQMSGGELSLLSTLENVPGDMLHYVIDVPAADEILPFAEALAAAAGTDGGSTSTDTTGDTDTTGGTDTTGAGSGTDTGGGSGTDTTGSGGTDTTGGSGGTDTTGGGGTDTTGGDEPVDTLPPGMHPIGELDIA
jgi:hypothetical protein